MKWEPADVIRLVALIGALLLFALGAVMMWKGIAAEGAIDIKSSVMSGTIKTGSAGLFIAFLAFVTIVFVLWSLGMKSQMLHAMAHGVGKKSSGIGKAFFILLALTVMSGFLAALGFGDGFAPISFAFGFLMAMTGAAYLTFLEHE